MFNYQIVIMNFTLGGKMNKLIISFLASLLVVPMVLACTNPIIYNEFGVPFNLYGTGITVIKSSDFPDGSSWVKYPLNISNKNSQQLTVNLTPSSDLALVVKPTSVTLAAGENKEVDLDIDVRRDKSGQLYVTGQCADTLPFGEGAINLGIDSVSNNPVQQCNNNVLSCGLYPDCQDLTKVDNKCFNGYLRDYWCTSNVAQYKDSCSNTCCRAYLGPNAACKLVGGVSKCVGSEVTVAINVSNNVTSKSLNLTLFEMGTSNQIYSSMITGSGSLKSSLPNVDLRGDFDNSKFVFIFRNLTFSSLGSNSKIIIDNTNVSIGTLKVYKAFYVQLPNGMMYKNISLQIKYDDAQYGNVNSLAIYKCSDYDVVNKKCNQEWTKQTTTLANGYANAEVTSFSAYMLAEPQQTTTTTQPSYGGGSSGGSSGGSGGGSGGSSGGSSGGGGSLIIPPRSSTTTTIVPSKPTGFYNISSTSLTIQAGSSQSITAEFFSNFQPSLKGMSFSLLGINSDWVTIEPSTVNEVFPEDVIELKITVTVPENTTVEQYPLTLQAKTPTTPVRYESTLDLIVTPAPVTTTTTTLPSNKPLIPTGLVDAAQTVLMKGWPLIVVVIGLGALIKFYPRESKTYKYSASTKKGSKGTFYKVVDDDSPDYVRLEIEESPKEEVRQEVKEEKNTNPQMEEGRQKVIEEIRKRAMKEEKRLKKG